MTLCLRTLVHPEVCDHSVKTSKEETQAQGVTLVPCIAEPVAEEASLQLQWFMAVFVDSFKRKLNIIQ